MLVEIVVLIIMTVAACRYMGAFMEWFERERGAGPGKNGWV